jgi:hypothetical protein
LKASREEEADMTSTRTAIILATAVALASPAPCAAQEPVRSFDQLNTRLKPGDTVWVTDAQGRDIKGKIQALAPGAITLRGDDPRTFAARDVSIIRKREPDSLKNGALIGLGAGAGIAIAACAEISRNEDNDAAWCAVAFGFYGGIGAGIGVGIDALIPGKKLVAYRAPGSSPARLSIAPVVTPRAKGVAVSFAF